MTSGARREQLVDESVKAERPEWDRLRHRPAQPTGYGLGRHGWVSIQIGDDADESLWQEVEEWVRTSYTLVAPKTLARIVLADDGLA